MVKVKYVIAGGEEVPYGEAVYVDVIEVEAGGLGALFEEEDKVERYSLLHRGEETCKHKRSGYTLESSQGIAFAIFECTECGETLAQCIGEVLPPLNFINE